MDGNGGTLKNYIYRDVMSEKCVIDTPQQFSDHSDKTITGITSLYLAEEEVLVEPEGIEKAPRIKDTQQVHMVIRLFKVPHLESFNLASDKKPFLLNTISNIQAVDINATQSMIVTVFFVWSIIN